MNNIISKRAFRLCITALIFTVLLLGPGCERDAHQVQHAESLEMVPLETVAENADYKRWLVNLPAYSRGYDPTRDPGADLEAAKIAAAQSNKLIFLVVGGDWCSWCHVMTRFFSENEALQEQLISHYELLKVNMSETNPNDAFLAELPEIDGYPHIFILSASGQLLHSQDTFQLEDGNSYSDEKFLNLLQRFLGRHD